MALILKRLTLKNYLSKTEVDNIKTHLYKTSGYSYLDKKFNPFWEKCASKLPYNFTPNRVTLTGAAFLYLGVIILCLFDITLTKPLPLWMYILFSLCIFLGQTFDAIDGKHARNTKRGSPLGQLMDHGCDAITNSCIGIYIAQSFTLGTSVSSLVLLQSVVHIAFYVATWEENRTGIINTHVNNFGVTETQLIAMILCLHNFIPKLVEMFSKMIFMEITTIDVCIYVAVIGISNIVIFTILKVFKTEEKSNYLKAFKPLINLIIIIVSEILISQFYYYKEYMLLFIILNGLYFGLTVSKLIVTTMSKLKLEIPAKEACFYLCTVLLGLYFPSIEILIIIAQITYVSCYYVRYFGSIVLQLLKELNIPKF